MAAGNLRLRQIQVMRLYLAVETAAAEDPLRPLEAFGDRRAGRVRNEAVHFFSRDDNGSVSEYFAEFGEPGDLLAGFVDDPDNDELTPDLCPLVFSFILRDFKEALYDTVGSDGREWQHRVDELLGGVAEADAVASLDAAFGVDAGKRMMRHFKRWRAVALGVNGTPEHTDAVRAVVMGEALPKDWAPTPLTIGTYDYEAEKLRKHRTWCIRFNKFAKQNGKAAANAMLAAAVGELTVPVGLSFASALNVLKDKWKIKHLEPPTLAAKLALLTRVVTWEDGLLADAVASLVAAGGFDPAARPDYSELYGDVMAYVADL